MADSTLKTIHPWLQENTTETPSGATIKSYSHDNGSDPILCVVHGYPQTSYQWRHVLPTWKPHFTLFVPELPGYGISTLPTTSKQTNPPTYNKREIALSILQALHATLGPTSHSRPIHWIAHDRGARIGHRLLTAPSPPPNLASAVFIDIVPTLEQWRAFAHPAASVAYFHWPFLAMGTAPRVIEGMGGGAFCRMVLARGRGANVQGHEGIESEDAYGHYAGVFGRAEAVEGSCADYAGGAGEECAAQEGEQREGLKVRVPLLVVYSEGSLGRMNDVEGVWPRWVERGVEGVRFVGVGDGHGHYLPESAGALVAEKVLEFVKKGLQGTKL